VIAVFMTKAKFFDPVLIAALKKQGYDEAGIIKLYANYDLLSVGAAIQNMLLAIHEKGYGACRMNAPAITSPTPGLPFGFWSEGQSFYSFFQFNQPTSNKEPASLTD
jgi:nitroreductase